MGSSSSKAAKTAASAAKRKYPQQASPATTNNTHRPPPAGHPSTPGPTVHRQPKASATRDDCTHGIRHYEHIADDYSHQLRCFRPSVRCVSPLARPSNAIFDFIQFVSVSFFAEFGPFYQPLKSIAAGVPRSNPKSSNLSAYRQRESGP